MTGLEKISQALEKGSQNVSAMSVQQANTEVYRPKVAQTLMDPQVSQVLQVNQIRG